MCRLGLPLSQASLQQCSKSSQVACVGDLSYLILPIWSSRIITKQHVAFSPSWQRPSAQKVLVAARFSTGSVQGFIWLTARQYRMSRLYGDTAGFECLLEAKGHLWSFGPLVCLMSEGLLQQAPWGSLFLAALSGQRQC